MPRLDLISLGAILAYITGLVWRFYYIFIAHPATNYVYSDMQTYVDQAVKFFTPGYQFTIADTVYPPGTGFFFGAILHASQSWYGVMLAQFTMSALIPILIMLIAYELYNSKIAFASLALSSLYFPFIEYASFFLSENPFMFFLLLATLLLIKSLQTPAGWRIWVYGIASGMSLGIAAVFKSFILVPALFVGLYLLWAKNFQYKQIARPLAWNAVGILLIILPATLWCTSLNEDRLCVISTNGPLGVLQGHYGNTGMFYFEDKERGYYWTFGSPAALQQGFTEQAHLPFGIYDSNAMLGATWIWISTHPLDALLLSIDHVPDLFINNIPFPTVGTAQKRWMILFQNIFLVCMLLPILYHLVKNIPALRERNKLALTDMFLFIPLIGMMAVAFLTIAETRYRIPFDSLLIILTARVYMQTSGCSDSKCIV